MGLKTFTCRGSRCLGYSLKLVFPILEKKDRLIEDINHLYLIGIKACNVNYQIKKCSGVPLTTEYSESVYQLIIRLRDFLTNRRVKTPQNKKTALLDVEVQG